MLINDWCQQYPSHSVGEAGHSARTAPCTSTAGDGASFNFTDYGQAGSPENPCGDPRRTSTARMTRTHGRRGRAACAGPANARRSNRPGTGALLRLEPGHRRGNARQPTDRVAGCQARRIIALRNAKRVPLHVPSGHQRHLAGRRGLGARGKRSTGFRTRRPACATSDGPASRASPRTQAATADLDDVPRACTATGRHDHPVLPPSSTVPTWPARPAPPMPGRLVSGLTFYTGDAYPSQFQGALFFADYRAVHLRHAGRRHGLPDPPTSSRSHGAAKCTRSEDRPGWRHLLRRLRRWTTCTGSATREGPAARRPRSPRRAHHGTVPFTVNFDGTELRSGWRSADLRMGPGRRR